MTYFITLAKGSTRSHRW